MQAVVVAEHITEVLKALVMVAVVMVLIGMLQELHLGSITQAEAVVVGAQEHLIALVQMAAPVLSYSNT
jgi:hypothetical protein